MLVTKNIKLINNSNIVSIAPFFMPQSHPLDVEVLPFLIPIIKNTIIIKIVVITFKAFILIDVMHSISLKLVLLKENILMFLNKKKYFS